MYLHIGNNDMVLVRNVIGVFDLDKIKNNNNNSKFLSKITEKEIKENKTVVLTIENGLLKPYYTNISVMTIKKRIERGLNTK